MNNQDDTRRLDWLLCLLWCTGHRDSEAARSLAKLKRLRRLICDSSFPFRDALDEVIAEGEEAAT